MLLAVSDLRPHWEFVGQDVDLRCVRMTAINLSLRNLYGYVIWGNSLGLEKRLVYRTGFNLRGVIREISIKDCPAPVQQATAEPTVVATQNSLNDPVASNYDDAPATPGKQLQLF